MCRITFPLPLRVRRGGSHGATFQSPGGLLAHLLPLLIRHSGPGGDLGQQASAAGAYARRRELAHSDAWRCRYGQGHGTRLSRAQALLLQRHHGHSGGFDHEDRLGQQIRGGVLGTNSLDDLVRGALELAR
jgi:hypothetical protein